jgi:NAD(P)-dependent dehydrogenase (short-subunit alcohol dehydrogenase family)
VLVSGGTSGIGLEIARGFALLGARTLVTGTSGHKIEQEKADPANAGLTFDRLDVRDRAAVYALAAKLPTLDVLVNAAGVGKGIAEFDEDVFLEVMDVNLNSIMRLSTAFRDKLAQTRGSIVNIASMLSYLVEPEVPAYTASKTGVLGLTRALAHAYGPQGIRVNAIAPGYHKTAMTKPLWSQPKSHDLIADHAALKRWGTTEDLVGTAVFLASPAAAFVTGTTLPVDGGYVVGNTIR